MTALAEREIVCSECSDPLGEYTTEPPYTRVGRCCENLPAPWDRDQNTGLYTAPGDGRDDDDYDEPETRRVPSCTYCGDESFTLRYTETRYCSVNSAEGEDGDETIFFTQGYEENLDSTEEGHCVECASCGRPANVSWEWT